MMFKWLERPVVGKTRHCLDLLLLAVALSVPGACSKSGSPPVPSKSPVLLFAVDGLEWKVMLPLLERGELPFIESLMSSGVFGQLESMEPTLSPVIWTSVATGRLPAEHGIEGFVYREHGNGKAKQRYYTSVHRQTKAFWDILSDYGLRVHTIGWWMTYPAEPINGIMVSQANTRSPLEDRRRGLRKGGIERDVEGQVHPVELEGRVVETLNAVEDSLDEQLIEIFGSRAHPSSELAEAFWNQTRWAFRADATYFRVAREILDRGEPFDLLALYIGGTDVVAHRFWRYAYPDEFEYPPTVEQIENYGQVIDDYYRYVDSELGELLRAAPGNSTVVLLSDHGIHSINTDSRAEAGDPPRQTNSAHHREAPPGVFIAAGSPVLEPGVSPESRISGVGALPSLGGILDVLPTILALTQIPIGEDLTGTVLEDLLSPDWLRDHPLRFLASHETEDWRQERSKGSADAMAEQERLEQLRELGYID
jgi:predicted AlkP superfamily pyrophosphatase or phosphodiesterase